ncbi:MAG: hypothetical protein ACRC67_38620 [Inquilinus sp.]|uniref:hypothetical protein n=1 Tax=Inquilinus sp. TaxID=1932117 RepID=UPI003F3538F8
MASPDDASATATKPPDLAEAIAALAKALRPERETPSESGFLKWLKGISEALLPSVVMFVLGFIFIQGVELDLKREEFTASAADKLKSYVDDLITPEPNASVEELRATALALGGFGGVAAIPLVSIVEYGGEQRIAAAQLGLIQAGRVAPDLTCAVIASVIDDPTAAYKWQTRKAIVEVAGLVGCVDAQAPLETLRSGISTMAGLTAEQRSNFVQAIDEALKRIGAAKGRKRGWFS